MDALARAGRTEILRNRARAARIFLKIQAQEKDSPLLDAIKDLPTPPSSLFGGRLFNAVESLASHAERQQAATTLVASIGKGYSLNVEAQSKGVKRSQAGSSGGPDAKKPKSGNPPAGGDRSAPSNAGQAKQTSASKSSKGTGQQEK